MRSDADGIPQEVITDLYDDATQSPSHEPLTSWPVLNAAALYGTAGELVRLIEPETESDPAGLLIQALTMFGNMAGRGRYFQVEADRHYGTLFVNLVGRTAGGRKGTSFGRVQHGLATVDDEWMRDRQARGLSSGEGLIVAVRDPVVKDGKLVDDGVPDKRLLVVETEFASVLSIKGRDASILSPVLRCAWDGTSLSTLTKNNPTRATKPHISIIGHITLPELRRLLTLTDMANGFANRFLWLCVKRSKLLPHGGNIAEDAFNAVRERFRRSLEFAKIEGRIKWDAEARLDYETLYRGLAKEKPGLLGAITARAEAQICRLALLYAILDCSPVIQPVHLEAATALWDYCEDSCRYIFGDALGDREADEIVRALREAGDEGMTRTEINALFHGHAKSAQINRALQLLEQMELAHYILEPTSGKFTERWFIGVAEKAEKAN